MIIMSQKAGIELRLFQDLASQSVYAALLVTEELRPL